MPFSSSEVQVTAFAECVSHPGRLLTDHLHGVAEEVDRALRQPPADHAAGLRPYAVAAALTHDVAKATRYFQHDRLVLRRKNEHTSHALAGAVFTWAVCDALTPPDPEAHLSRTGITAVAVQRHHGNLGDDPLRSFLDKVGNSLPLLRDQLAALDLSGAASWLEAELNRFGVTLAKSLPREADPCLAPFQQPAVFKPRRNLRRRSADFAAATELRMLFSALIGRDKLDAGFSGDYQRTGSVVLGPELVHRYRKKLHEERPGASSPLDPLRSEVADTAADSLSTLLSADDTAGPFTLTAPTGTGKTLTGLETAFALRQQREQENGWAPPIVYCLPFTAIIDQNFEVIRKVLEHSGIPTSTDVLLKHHHLAPREYSTAEGDEYETDGADLLVEGWESEIVVTTFVQLFDALTHPYNRACKRLYRLRGAIVLLDEVQAIPRKFWETVRELFLTLTRDYSATVVLMTATQPLVLRSEDAAELMREPERLYQGLHRVELMNRARETTALGDFIEHVTERVEGNPERSIGVVLNTRKSTRRVGEALCHAFKDTHHVCYLTTWITPRERRARIEAFKQADGPKLLISTQLIEAGVDISVDELHRDFAPWDSVVQAAGRCNRNALTAGTVFLWRLVDEESGQPEKPLCQYVYDWLLLDATTKLLGTREQVPEADFFKLSAEYYHDLQDRGADAELERVYAEMRFEEMGKQFRLIEEQAPQRPVYVLADPEAQRYWNIYCAAQEEKEHGRGTAWAEFRKNKNQFYDRVIQVPLRKEESEPDGIETLYPGTADTAAGDEWYDPRFGYTRAGEGERRGGEIF